MYNPREDLFEEADDSQSSGLENISSPGSPSTELSYSSLTTPSVFNEEEDEIYFPSYDDSERGDKEESEDQVSSVESAPEVDSFVPRRVSPGSIERPEDDTAARMQPSRHVDYLSHEWTEEDVWASWKHVVSRRGLYPNSERLENASWRTWEKKRRNLKTISPETVKWLKDHDVTWLYGPLQPGFCTMDRRHTSQETYRACSSEACENKKPILKKRSLSELMLRRSVSSASLLKQAAITAEGQKNRQEASSSYSSFNFSTPGLTRANTTGLNSLTTSTYNSPSPDQGAWNSKNVRFHELVEQCIALAHLGDDEPEYHYISDSDDDVVLMRKTPMKRISKQRLQPMKPKKKPTPEKKKTIEKLPHATLKCPLEAEKEEEETSVFGLGISQSPTEAASPPTYPTSPNLSHHHDSGDDEEEKYWKPPAWLRNRKDSVQIYQDKLESLKISTSRTDLPLTRPHLDRRDAEAKEVPHAANAPLIEGKDASIRFELPPCRSQLQGFSFNCSTCAEPSVNTSSDDEDWINGTSFSPRNSDYFSVNSDDARSSDTDDSEHLPSVPAKTALLDRVMDDDEDEDNYNILTTFSGPPYSIPPPSSTRDESPRTSSDSGYGTSNEDREEWRVRDTRLEKEKERGITDWELYPDAWDEVDEAVAWQRGF